jgi:hypothetical protein
MLSGLGTITITDENYSEHVAFELGERDGLLFGGEEILRRAQRAKKVFLFLLTSRRELRIRIANVEHSCANFVVISEPLPAA